MTFLKKHVDSAVVIGVIISAVALMNTKVKDIRSEFREEFKIVHSDISELKVDVAQLKTDIAIVKTVLIMKNIMPQELALHQETDK